MQEKLKGLYAITDPELLQQDRLLKGVQDALEGGAKLIQYRDKQASAIERLRNCQSLLSLCNEFESAFIVNDDLELCLRIGAHGVHLGKQDGDVQAARLRLDAGQILGVTCHNDHQYAQRMAEIGVDYCAFGRIFPSHTKPNAPACELTQLKQLSNIPCATVAIGGITVDNAPQVLNYDIDMLAVIHGVFGQSDIKQAAHSFSILFS